MTVSTDPRLAGNATGITELHVVLDNLNTGEPTRDRWLTRRPNVHFRCTPTHASWLNQVETSLSIVARATHSDGAASRHQVT
jgi:hypothetical protein